MKEFENAKILKYCISNIVKLSVLKNRERERERERKREKGEGERRKREESCKVELTMFVPVFFFLFLLVPMPFFLLTASTIMMVMFLVTLLGCGKIQEEKIAIEIE